MPDYAALAQRYYCPQCGAGPFGNERGVAFHIAERHLQYLGMGSYGCWCDFQAVTRNDLYAHLELEGGAWRHWLMCGLGLTETT